MLGPDHLVCSHATLNGARPPDPARFSFAERVAAAAQAGFAGIGLHVRDQAALRDSGVSEADAAAMLADNGLVAHELEFIPDWAFGPEDADRFSQAQRNEEKVWAVADAFGPRVVSVGVFSKPDGLPFDVLAERFAAVCDRAAEHDLLVALEFTPASHLTDIAGAAALVEAAGRANAGINLDTWHWFRGNPDAEVLRAVTDRIFMVQFDDADADVVGTLFEDTISRRRYPGEGSFDLVGFLYLLRDAGVSVPLSVEILSDDHFALPVDEAARRACESSRRVMDRAWH